MSETYLHLYNIPETCSWTNIQTMFGSFGKIQKIYLHPKHEFGKVFFESSESTNKACQYVNSKHPMGLSGISYTSQTASKGKSDFDLSSDSNLSVSKNHYKQRRVNDDVDTSVNRNYVDVFGRVVTTLQDDNGDLYVSLNELKKSGFELFQMGSLPVRNGCHVYDAQKIAQFEMFMKMQAAQFISKNNLNVPEEKINKIIESEKQDYFNTNRKGNSGRIPSLLDIKTSPVPTTSHETENHVKNKGERIIKEQSNNKRFEKTKKEEVNTLQCNGESVTSLRRPLLTSQLNKEQDGDSIFKAQSNNKKIESIRKEGEEKSNEVIADAEPLSRVSLQLNKEQEVSVVHIESNTVAWVQLTSNTKVIEDLMVEVMEEIETASKVTPTLNMICAALYKDIWFRAIVLNTSPLKVQYIDYGNENSEPLRKVLQLSKKLRSLPAQGIRIRFESSPDRKIDHGETLRLYPTQQEKDGTYIVRINKPKVFHSTPLNSPLIHSTKNEAAATIVKKENDRKLSIETNATNGIFEFGQRTSETTFVVFALPDNLDVEVCTLEEISNDCKPDPSFKPNVGDLVAAQTSQGFVRALIIDNLNGQYKCGLIDYGTTETTSEVCLLPDKYVLIPEFSFECQLDPTAIEEIQTYKSGTITIKSPGLVTFRLESQKEYEAKGYRWNPIPLPPSKNKSTLSESKGTLKSPSESNERQRKTPNPINEESSRKTVIERVSDNSIFDFVEATSDTTFIAFAFPESFTEEFCALETITDDTRSDTSFIPKVGDLAAALTSDGFVRALVTEVQTNGYKCALIDYGTTKLTTEVRRLPDKYKTIPEFAFECETTANILEDFKKHKCTSCTISSPNVLTVTLDNGNKYTIEGHRWNPLKNISSIQTPAKKISEPVKKLRKRKLVIDDTCETGIFEYVEKIDEHRFVAFGLPDSFQDELCALECLSDDCKYDPSFRPQLEDLVALQTADSFGRGIILDIKDDQYKCGLIDYGTIETTNKVYKLPDKYSEIPEFAFVCKLDDGSIDDFKNSKCVSLQIKTPKILNVTLESGKCYALHGSHWNPNEMFQNANEKPACETNLIKNIDKKRKLVIDDTCETGVFEFIQSIDDTTFIGFAFPSKYMKEVEKLNEINDNASPDPTFKPKPGDLVAALSSSGLARASVVKNVKGQYQCAFIDHGLVDIVDQVHPLPDVYRLIPEFSFECKTDSETLKILETTPCKTMEIKSPRALSLTLESGKKFEIKGYSWDPFKSNTFNKLRKPSQTVFKGEPSGKVLKGGEQIMICGVLDSCILVRTRECHALLKTVKQELINYKGEEFLKRPEVNCLAVCHFNDDNYYRVLIRGINESSALIEYVDYGDIASMPIKSLKTISAKLASMENTLIKIRLKDFVESSFDLTVLDALKTISEKNEKFVVEKVSGENVYELIGANNVTLSNRLKDFTRSSTCLTPKSSKKDSIINAIVSKKKNVCTLSDITKHNITTGPNEFLCLFTDYLNEGNVSFCKADDETAELLNKITTEIQKCTETNNTPYQPEQFEVCLVKFEDDWFRAAVVKINENKTYGVFYVDYGNSRVVTSNDIRKLPDELREIRGLAILCTLEGVMKKDEEVVSKPLLSRLHEDILENQIYHVNVIACKNNEYKITIPALYKIWKNDGLLQDFTL